MATALTVSASLAQIGEFSFILAALGVTLGLLPPEGRDLILAGALISITLNPFVFATITPVTRWVRARPGLAALVERGAARLATLPDNPRSNPLRDHAVIVGYGRVGGVIGATLASERPAVRRGRAGPAAGGSAARARHPRDLRGCLCGRRARCAQASRLRSCSSSPRRTAMPRAACWISRARRIRASTSSSARTTTRARALRAAEVGRVMMGERELALGMTEYALDAASG